MNIPGFLCGQDRRSPRTYSLARNLAFAGVRSVRPASKRATFANHVAFNHRSTFTKLTTLFGYRLTFFFQALADAAYLSGRPLPDAPDGRYDAQVKPATDPADSSANHSALYKLVTDIETRLKKGPIIKDPKIIVRLQSSFSINTMLRAYLRVACCA